MIRTFAWSSLLARKGRDIDEVIADDCLDSPLLDRRHSHGWEVDQSLL